MKWEAHTRTAQKILADFDAYHFQKYEKDLINGIIYPDSNDPKPHRGREEAIQENIMRARERRLEYNPSDSFFYLGMAFHYIQDSWVGMDPDHEDYSKYEKLIDKNTILGLGDDLFRYYPVTRNRVYKQFKDYDARLSTPLKNPEDMFKLASSVPPFESTAFLDLNLSYRVCHRVAEMVLKPMLKASLDENLSKIHVEYTEKLVDIEHKEREILYKLEAYVGVESQGLLSGVENWKRKQALDKRYAAYGKGAHLKKIFKAYSMESGALAKPFVDWYNVTVPELVLPAVDPVVGVESAIILNVDDPTVPLVANSNAKKP
jgi:hypothetical protein